MKVFALLALVTLACGGSTVAHSDAGAASDGGGSGSSSGGGSSSGADAGTTCQSLVDEIDRLRPGAQACCPSCNHAPCAFFVDDVCCPLTVDSQSSSAVLAFEQAVQQYKTLKCLMACPALACQTAPSGMCNATTSACQ